nr:MAG TPA: hypothetical protein [Bacteriophage sp.]
MLKESYNQTIGYPHVSHGYTYNILHILRQVNIF